MLSSTNTPKSAAAIAIRNARDDRAWLSTRPAEIEEVAARQLELRRQPLAYFLGGPAEVAARDGGLHRDATGSSLAANGGRAERLRDLGQLAERDLGPVVPVDQQGLDGVEVAAPVVPQTHHQVEPALAAPHLGAFLANQAHPDGANHVARGQAHARRGLTIDGDLQLRQAGQRLGTQICQAARHRP